MLMFSIFMKALCAEQIQECAAELLVHGTWISARR